MSWDTSERELETHFSKFGRIERCQVVMDRTTGRSRGFAFINFETVKEVIKTGCG